MRTRSIVIPLACVAAGAAITLAVAWGCVVFADVSRSETLHGATGWPIPAPESWPEPEFATVGKTVGYAGWVSMTMSRPRHVIERDQAGWPFYALTSHRLTMGTEVAGVVAFREEQGRLEVPYPIWTGKPRLNPTVVLPTKVIWVGYTFNTVAYGALVWLMTLVPGWVRRSRRRARGACAKCGYDLAATPGITKCPECGQEAAGSAEKPGT